MWQGQASQSSSKALEDAACAGCTGLPTAGASKGHCLQLRARWQSFSSPLWHWDLQPQGSPRAASLACGCVVDLPRAETVGLCSRLHAPERFPESCVCMHTCGQALESSLRGMPCAVTPPAHVRVLLLCEASLLPCQGFNLTAPVHCVLTWPLSSPPKALHPDRAQAAVLPEEMPSAAALHVAGAVVRYLPFSHPCSTHPGAAAPRVPGQVQTLAAACSRVPGTALLGFHGCRR